MHIVYFHKRVVQIGGAEKLLISECNELSRIGKSVTIFSYYMENNIRKMLDDRVQVIEYGAQYRTPNIIIDIILFNKFLKYVKYHKHALFISACGYYEILIASLTFRIKYFLEDHHPITMSPLNSIRSALQIRKRIKQHYPESLYFNLNSKVDNNTMYRHFIFSIKYIFMKSLFSRAREIFVLSEYAQKEKLALLGCKAKIIYGGIGTEIKRFIPELAALDNEEKKIIRTISRLSKNKNLDKLILGFKHSKLHKENWILEIYGDGPERIPLATLIHEERMDSAIKLMGYIEEDALIQIIYSASVIAVIDYADFNITTMEALCLNTKLIINSVNYIHPDIEAVSFVVRTHIGDMERFSADLHRCAVSKHEKNPKQVFSVVYKLMSWKNRVERLTTQFSAHTE